MKFRYAAAVLAVAVLMMVQSVDARAAVRRQSSLLDDKKLDPMQLPCNWDNGGCDQDAVCTNMPPEKSGDPWGTVCMCKPGYSGDGTTCIETTGCSKVKTMCHPLAECIDTANGPVCACIIGYQGDGKTTCEPLYVSDTDPPCNVSNGGCHRLAVCRVIKSTANTPNPERTCRCWPGTIGNGTHCRDPDACKRRDRCKPYGACFNTPDYYRCECKPGYNRVDTSDGGEMCTTVNPCQRYNGGCHQNASCLNPSSGKRSCVCKRGYTGDGLSCTRIDECAINNGGCNENANCTLTADTHFCTCKFGYAGDGYTCNEVDICEIENGGCFRNIGNPRDNALCAKTGPGTRSCRCKNGWSGDGINLCAECVTSSCSS